MGFDMYHKILDEAVTELKENEFKELFENELLKEETLQKLKEECTIETDLELLIPQDYVSNTSERLQLYTQLDNIRDEKSLDEFSKQLTDRFGPTPDSVVELIKSVELRWLAVYLGIEKLVIKNEVMKCYIPDSKDPIYFQSSIFGAILKYVQIHPNISIMKEYKQKLIISIKKADNIDKAIAILNEIKSMA